MNNNKDNQRSYQQANTTERNEHVQIINHNSIDGNDNGNGNTDDDSVTMRRRMPSPSSLDEDDHDHDRYTAIETIEARHAFLNFVWMSVFFSANHGCVVACLSLATTRLGYVGAWQSGILYLCYTASALLGATYVVKQLGSRNALIFGMTLYCAYVGCFWVATLVAQHEQEEQEQELQRQQQQQPSASLATTTIALLGAAIGGIGAGFLWTAQGSYFGRAAEDHANHLQQDVAISNSTFASLFAFLYLAEEVALRALSTLLLELGWAWSVVFGCYTTVTVLSTILMVFVYDYPTAATLESNTATSTTRAAAAPPTTTLRSGAESSSPTTISVWYKVTAAWQLLRKDSKMKYMIGLNAVFGLTAAFLNSYINGEVVRVATHDEKSKSVGLFNAWVSCVAAGMSLVFGKVSNHIGDNGPILIVGSLCFFGVVLPFVLVPDSTRWGTPMLFLVYTFHGTGRATFESTLKATFADYFAYEKEGAFANIILQSGLSGAIGYILTFTLLCSEEGRYCIKYSDGSLHDVLSFELLVIFSAVLAILGYVRASALHRMELTRTQASQDVENDAMIPLSSTAASED